MTQYSFKVLRFAFSLFTSLLLAWLVAAISSVNVWLVFAVFAIGLPVASWINRLKNVPAHLAAAYLLNKQFVADAKRALKRLPITSADEWSELESFYDDDTEIEKYYLSNPKTFVVVSRYSFSTLRAFGLFIPAIQGQWVITQALNQLWEEGLKAEKHGK